MPGQDISRIMRAYNPVNIEETPDTKEEIKEELEESGMIIKGKREYVLIYDAKRKNYAIILPKEEVERKAREIIRKKKDKPEIFSIPEGKINDLERRLEYKIDILQFIKRIMDNGGEKINYRVMKDHLELTLE